MEKKAVSPAKGKKRPGKKPESPAPKGLGPRRLAHLSERYFARCQAEHMHPSLPGLALALGFPCRQAMEQALSTAPQAEPVVRRAMTRVEEATVQSAFTKDLASSAKFILQNGFGYSEKATVAQAPEEIRVTVGGEDA